MLNLRTIVEDGEAGNDRAPICCVIDTELVGWKLIMEQWKLGVLRRPVESGASRVVVGGNLKPSDHSCCMID